MDVWRAAQRMLAAGEAPVLVTVIDARGSTPRHAGAHMLVRADGSIAGTIGGGRIEKDAIDAAMRVHAGEPAQRLTRHLVRDLAMCCGGSMDLWVEPAAASRDALVAVARALDDRVPCELVTPLDGAPKRVRAPTGVRRPRVDGDEFVEPVRPPDRLVLFGAGHVARAIGPLAHGVGFEVVVCDDGEVVDVPSPPAWASAWVDSFDPADVERAIGPLGDGDYAVIVTRDHAIDQRVLERLIGNDALAYIGLIGSRRKVERFRARLDAKGLVDDARWARLHAPVGLAIGAETPEEIAVAIVAELIRERRR
ncbi:MAG: xanthine dehydrogenase accessory protein XdhC [Deltaproteobacteria bacterium]|nr:MAG: xanthine dehydrogenase accessory protein XdhC [Deltaproteobacteria bacterium]